MVKSVIQILNYTFDVYYVNHFLLKMQYLSGVMVDSYCRGYSAIVIHIEGYSMLRIELRCFKNLEEPDKKRLYSYVYKMPADEVLITHVHQLNRDIEDWMSRTGSEYFGVYADNKLVGTISLSKQHKEEGYASIGYDIFPEFRGMGIASKAFSLMLDIAGSRGFKLVKGKVRNDNEHSLRIWLKHNAQSIDLADGMLEMRVEIKEKKC